MNHNQRLKHRVETGPTLLLPGAANALTARVIEEIGFDAVYVTGAGVANTFLGGPDIGLVTMTEMSGHIAAIRDAVDLPLIVDGDTGFGNPIGVQRTIREYERAGASAIQLEDQTFPKRCGHFGGKSVISAADMVQKIHAAVDARSDDDFLVIARTDARAGGELAEAVDRAQLYRQAGADVLFIEAPSSVEELLSLPSLVDCPQLANMVEGGRTPLVPLEQLGEFSIVLYANAALQGAIAGIYRVLEPLHRDGSLDNALGELAPWSRRQETVRKGHFDDLENKYAAKNAPRDEPSP